MFSSVMGLPVSDSSRTAKTSKDHLLEVAVSMLQKHGLEYITSDRVLRESHVSKGSLYHHYEDFQDLIEDAQIHLYTEHVINTLEGLITFVRKNQNPEDVRAQFKNLVRAPETVGSVFFREQKFAIAYAGTRSERMRKKLAPVQELLTQKWILIAEICKQRDWVSPDLDSRAISILLQSTIIGKILDDNSSLHLDFDQWVKALDYIFDVVFFGNLGNYAHSKEHEQNSGIAAEPERYLLQLEENADTSSYVKNFIDSIYKMYKIEIISSAHADEALKLYLTNSDSPNFTNESQDQIPTSTFSNMWKGNNTVYGAFYDNKLVGFVNCKSDSREAEVEKCIIDRSHRGKGIATALVSFLILSKLNKGITSFVSEEDRTVPARLEIMSQLGFKPDANLKSGSPKDVSFAN